MLSWPANPAGGGSIPAAAEAVIALARGDLAARHKVAAADVEVSAVEAKEWPDTSLGHPQPGMMYAQVITPGFRVVLRVAGRSYVYHTDRRRVVLVGEVKSPS